jgi:hypothetical protein
LIASYWTPAAILRTPILEHLGLHFYLQLALFNPNSHPIAERPYQDSTMLKPKLSIGSGCVTTGGLVSPDIEGKK